MDGIQFFHDNNYVLRDLKHDNVLVKRNELEFRCKLIDFGMSGYADRIISLSMY